MPTVKTIQITSQAYDSAVKQRDGWCTECQEFTAPNTPLDAEDLKCPRCELQTVLGAEMALFFAHLAVAG